MKQNIERMRDFYYNEVKSHFKKIGYENSLAIPKLTKIVLSMGIGDYIKEDKTKDLIFNDLQNVAAQKPIYTVAKKSIATFNIRDGFQVGLKVTLRGKKMYNFLDRFINVAMVRSRDFTGFLGKSIYGNKKGGYNFCYGVKDISIFPEVEKRGISGSIGMNIVFCTDSKKNTECLELLKTFNFPFVQGVK